jgi:hypothetical protein
LLWDENETVGSTLVPADFQRHLREWSRPRFS